MGNLTAEEVVKITLGIIGISFLIYLSVSLVGIFTYKTASEQAKATLDELTTVANNLQPGQSKEMLITSPKEWSLVILNDELCICPSKKIEYSSNEDFYESCSKEAICQKDEKLKFNIQRFCPAQNLEIIEKCIFIKTMKTIEISRNPNEGYSNNYLIDSKISQEELNRLEETKRTEPEFVAPYVESREISDEEKERNAPINF